ncbi:transposase family protein [Lactovum odontotermitis]
MSYSDSIKLLLHIQDPNIEIQELSTEFKRKQEVSIVHACLTYAPPPCPDCRAKAVKNGFTSSDVLMPKVANFKTCLRLKKQRFKCSSPDCGRSFLAETALVKRYHQISQPVHLGMRI